MGILLVKGQAGKVGLVGDDVPITKDMIVSKSKNYSY